VAIGALVQRPLTSIMSAGGEKPVRRVTDLDHGRVGTAGIPYQDAYLRTVLQHAGVDASSVTHVDVGFNLIPAMLSKRVDATLGAFWNVEGVQLRRAHKHPSIIPIDRAGVPTYNELVFVARAQDLRSRGGLLEAAEVHGNWYGTPVQQVRGILAAGRDAILTIDPQGARSVRGLVPDALLIFVMPFAALSVYSLTGSGGTYAIENFQYVLGSFGENLSWSFRIAALTLVIDLFFAVVFIAVMYFYSPLLTWIVLASFPFYIGISAGVTPLFRQRLDEKFQRGAENQAFLVESVTGVETLKAMAVEPQMQRRWEEQLAGYHLWHATRADLLRRLGRTNEAIAAYRRAHELAQNETERQFLERRLRELQR